MAKINPEAFLHESDKKAMADLKKIPAFDKICTKLIDMVDESFFKVQDMSSKVRISKEQMPRIYNMLVDICEKLSEVLDLEYETLFERIQKKQNYWTVATNVDTKKGDEIRAWANEKDLDSITVEDDTKRYYPGGSLASHVI